MRSLFRRPCSRCGENIREGEPYDVGDIVNGRSSYTHLTCPPKPDPPENGAYRLRAKNGALVDVLLPSPQGLSVQAFVKLGLALDDVMAEENKIRHLVIRLEAK